MNFKKMLAAAVFGLLFQGAAHAQLYLGIEGGLTVFEDTTDDYANLYTNGYGADSAKVTQNRIAVPLRPFIGAELTDNIAVEAGYSFFSIETKVKGHAGSSGYNDTWTTSWRILDYAVLLRPNAGSGWHGLFARIGGHSSTAESEWKRSGDAWAYGTGTGTDTDSESTSGLQLGFGYDLALGRSKSNVLRFSYTYYDNMPGLNEDDKSLKILKFGYFYKF